MDKMDMGVSEAKEDKLMGKMERGEAELDIEHGITRAEIERVIKNYYTHGNSQSPKCCDFEIVNYPIDSSQLRHLMMPQTPTHKYGECCEPVEYHIVEKVDSIKRP
jgi:hypothetical protein